MIQPKPKFNPNKSFEVADSGKPKFNPNAPFESKQVDRFQDTQGAEQFLMDYYEQNVNLFPEVNQEEGPLPDIQGVQSVPGEESVIQQTEVPQQVIEDTPVEISRSTGSISEGYLDDVSSGRPPNYALNASRA